LSHNRYEKLRNGIGQGNSENVAEVLIQTGFDAVAFDLNLKCLKSRTNVKNYKLNQTCKSLEILILNLTTF
jgi:hypothetical protein